MKVKPVKIKLKKRNFLVALVIMKTGGGKHKNKKKQMKQQHWDI